VRGAFERAGKSRVSAFPSSSVVSVQLSVAPVASGDRRGASVSDDMDEIEVTYSVEVPGGDDADSVDQQQIDSLSANLAPVTAEDYTQDFESEMSGVAGAASFGVEPVANSAAAPTATAEQDPLTPAPTPSPTSGVVSATGDPHLVNIHGQRFDLMQPGLHTLVHIPRRAEAARTFLDIRAAVQRVGASCADMYIMSINVTGVWASAPKHPAGIFFSVKKSEQNLGWQNLGQVKLKVVQGHTKTGIAYLNFLIQGLSKVEYSIGGLLGVDDHTDASKVDPHCRTLMAI